MVSQRVCGVCMNAPSPRGTTLWTLCGTLMHSTSATHLQKSLKWKKRFALTFVNYFVYSNLFLYFVDLFTFVFILHSRRCGRGQCGTSHGWVQCIVIWYLALNCVAVHRVRYCDVIDMNEIMEWMNEWTIMECYHVRMECQWDVRLWLPSFRSMKHLRRVYFGWQIHGRRAHSHRHLSQQHGGWHSHSPDLWRPPQSQKWKMCAVNKCLICCNVLLYIIWYELFCDVNDCGWCTPYVGVCGYVICLM